jgi:type IV pilus assembly protein PilV
MQPAARPSTYIDQRKQSGATLLEVMIAILILSFGLLGMIGLIINSFKLTSSSNFRTVAAQQAYSIADTVRSDILLLAKFQDPSGTALADCLKEAGCTKDDMHLHEVAMWSARLASMLPQGRGTICSDATPNDGDPGNWECDAPVAAPGVPSGPFVVKVCWVEGQNWQISTDVDGNKTATWDCVRTNL